MDRFFLVDNLRVSVRSWIARELVSNILVHREYSKGFPAKIIIERDKLYAENWNRSNKHGRIDPSNFTPEAKNPMLAWFFVNIGRADFMGSGIRNLYKYTNIYSGNVPELVEGDVFSTTVPLKGIGAIGSTRGVSEIDLGVPNHGANVLENGSDGANLGADVPKNVPDVPDNGSENVPNVSKVSNPGADVPENVPNHGANVPKNGSNVPNAGANVPNLGADASDTDIATTILVSIAAEPEIKYSELATQLSLNRKTIQRHIQKLKEDGKLRRVGPRRTGYWEVSE